MSRKQMTIVVPVRNREKLVERCLDSLFQQTWRPLKIIVIDNGSSDNTYNIVRSWMSNHNSSEFETELLTESAPGACAARERGLSATHTEYVMFFDSDDVMLPETVERAMLAFKGHPHADIVAWPVRLRFLNGKIRKTKTFSGELTDIMSCHLVHSALRTQGYAVKTEYLRSIGGWDVSLPAWNDWELGVRLLSGMPKVVTFTEPGADIYLQKESITGENFSGKQGVWEKSLKAVARDLSSSEQFEVRRWLPVVAYRCAVLAAHYAKEGDPRKGNRLMKSLLYIMKKNKSSLIQRFAVRFAYRYTSAGFRGAYMLVRKFL